MKNNSPLVSVVCLCYNQAQFVVEAIQSVLDQSYSTIELIVVDDASTDNSAEVITNFLSNKDGIPFIALDENIGNCKAFNVALKHCRGEYIIDLAADDLLLPHRIAMGIEAFQHAEKDTGINFSDAAIINESGEFIRYHYQRSSTGQRIEEVPEGDVFEVVLRKYFICPPTIMVKKEVFDQLEGYDEALAYEDFDFWVRSSRKWKYCYTDEVLVKKRMVINSHGQQQYQRKSQQMQSTYVVCQKAFLLCRNKGDFKSLRQRIRYEMKHTLWQFNIGLSWRYLRLWLKSIFK